MAADGERRSGRVWRTMPLALALVAGVACSRGPVAPPEPAGVDGQKLLIKHGWDLPDPAFVRDNSAGMAARGFDGVMIGLESSDAVLSQAAVDYDQLVAELAPLREAELGAMRHNFVIVRSGDLGGYGSDWRVPVENMGHLARAAREAGLVGIAYDNEDYLGRLHDWSPDTSGMSLAAARAEADARGRAIMAAIADAWPDAHVMALLGPLVSDERTAEQLEPVFAYNDVAWANELLAPFFFGMAAVAVDRGVTLVDGGELYTPRSARQFAHAYEWMKRGVVGGGAVTEDLAEAYPSVVSVAFGVYDTPWLGAPMDAEVWLETLVNALQHSDRYVWAYTEAYDWWGTGWPERPVPQRWVDAVAEAKATRAR